MYSNQYGFRRKHDALQPLKQYLDKIYEEMNKDNPEYKIAKKYGKFKEKFGIEINR